MRKLVFGIIAVVLLQVAFYSYVAVITPTEDAADLRRSITVAKAPESGRVPLPRAAEPAEPKEESQVDSKVSRLKASEKPALHSRQTKLPTEARYIARPNPIRGDYVSSPEQFPERRIVRAKSSPAIPSGYTMVLVDYTKGGVPVAYSKPRARPLNRRTPIVSASLASERQVSEVAKTDRKRPYLARALPALVKKPWGWMKTLASKLK